MFFLQLIMVVVMPLMGPAVQEASFHSLSCFHPAEGHNPSYAATEEVLRVLLPQELCGGGQGPSALLWGPFYLPGSPNNMAWPRGNASCSRGPFESRLQAAWHSCLEGHIPLQQRVCTLKILVLL